jgi:hypothetical protein
MNVDAVFFDPQLVASAAQRPTLNISRGRVRELTAHYRRLYS